jgi:transcriptional regulator with XRE-family HTH domain
MTSFGEILLRMRKERDLSQKALGEALGIHQTTISGIECTERLPSPELLLALSRFFDVPVKDLLDTEAWTTSRLIARDARQKELAR